MTESCVWGANSTAENNRFHPSVAGLQRLREFKFQDRHHARLADGSTLHPRSIDLNADLGEGFPDDEALLALVTSASICCNQHAGNLDVIKRTLARRPSGVSWSAPIPAIAIAKVLAAREQEMTWVEVRDLILDQLSFIHSLAAEAGLTVRFVKPHGALYNQGSEIRKLRTG